MVGIDISVALPASPAAPAHIATAEKLGYTRGYLYDTPFEGGDVWVALHAAARQTTTIGLGPSVLIPNLRHPLVNAAQTVSLHHLAPGRVVVSFGTGFSSRAATGQKPLTWAYVQQYVETHQGLLAGRAMPWEGAPIQLMLTSTQHERLPLRVPVVIAATGPKGSEVARRVGADGIVSIFRVIPGQHDVDQAIVAAVGTVLDEGEALDSERVRLAAGPPWAGVFHLTYTTQGPEAVRKIPGGQAWLDVIEAYPAEERHLHIHRGHMVEMNDADLAAWNAGGYTTLPSTTLTGTADVVRQHVADMAGDGATEVMIEPSGPDITRELTSFAQAVRSAA